MNYSTLENEKNIKHSKQRTAKTRNKILVIFLRVFIALVLIAGFGVIGAGIGAYMGIIESAPEIEAVAIVPSIYPSIIYDRNGNEVTRLAGEQNREYVTLDRIPLHLQQAVIAIEDERFFQHNGVDIRGIFRALYSNFTSDTTQGASTLTQQVIKNIVRDIPRNTLGTKIQEIYLALRFEKDLVEQLGSREAAKNHILEVYLNTIFLSHGLNGVMTAASYYFDKDVSELTISEAAVIAGITQSPTRFSPINNPEQNQIRKGHVLGNMLRLGFITKEEYEYAIADEDVYNRIIANERISDSQNYIQSYFNDSLIEQVAQDLIDNLQISREQAFFAIFNSGLKIYSTQNMEMQEIVDDVFLDDRFYPEVGFKIDVIYTVTKRNTLTGRQENIERRGTVPNREAMDDFVESARRSVLRENDEIVAERIIPFPQPQAAMVLMDWTNGNVLAVAGGRGEKLVNRGLNRINSPRQPGSVFKTLAAFAPAIDLGKAHASTIVMDEPFTYEGYSPSNWYEGYRGPSTLRKGMEDSMNIVAVKTTINTGLRESFEYLKNFGFTTLVTPEDPIVTANGEVFHDMVPSLPLGGLTIGVTQLEVTAAYAAIANEGKYNEPKFYTLVLDQFGDVLLEQETMQKEIMRPQAAYIITDMMRGVVNRGTGGQARLRNTNIPVAGKTGTTSNGNDLLFAGYTPYIAAGIWMGYDQPEPIPTNNHHLQLWREVMERIHENYEYRDFQRPPGIIQATHWGITDLFVVGDYIDTSFVMPTVPKEGEEGEGVEEGEVLPPDLSEFFPPVATENPDYNDPQTTPAIIPPGNLYPTPTPYQTMPPYIPIATQPPSTATPVPPFIPPHLIPSVDDEE